MSHDSDTLAKLLQKTSRGLGGFAASRLLERQPAAAQCYPVGFAGWQSLLASLVEELAAGILANRPALFTAHALWTRILVSSRQTPIDMLLTALRSLREVMTDDLPEKFQSIAFSYLDEAISAIEHCEKDLRVESDGQPADRLVHEYLLAIFEGDRRKAGQLVFDQLRADHADVSSLITRVLLPAQHEVGRMWLAGEINVAEEHFATATTRYIITQLLPHAECRPARGKTLLSAAIAQNQHDLGVQVVSDFFEMDGWRVVYLGANIPIVDLVQAIEFYEPDLLALSAALTSQLPTLRDTINSVRTSPLGSRLKILVGGRALSENTDLATRLGADAYADGPAAAVEIGNRLVGSAA